jgi:2-oxoglutarate dehydrogenase E1 component
MDISFSNLEMIDQLYQSYKANPDSVDVSWRYFFEGWELGQLQPPGKSGSLDLQVYLMIDAYRRYGHLSAAINPLAPTPPAEAPELKLENFGFKAGDMQRVVPTSGFLKEKEAPLGKVVEALKKTYAGTIGIEYMGLGNPELEAWMQKRIEPNFPIPFSADEKISILHDLNRAEIFESFIHTKYTGQKRFSLEGGETFIPMLACILENAAEEGVSEALIAMAHRGRLNVLANILNKSYTTIFHEFEDHYTPDLTEGAGDVKYHKGFVGQLTTKKGKQINVTLSANASHLESQYPIVEGEARAKQEVSGKKGAIPIAIHGDAALAGQGVIYETMQLCNLKGYGTGGTIHVVINNQIGFTTLPKDSRSTRYCTDIAHGFGAPVFHVNVEKPEECVFAAKLSLELRQRFHCDVFLDLYCWRKYGHNEGDEPAFTQPIEYQTIRSKKPIREIYRDALVQEGVLDTAHAAKLESEFKANLQKALEAVPGSPSNPPTFKPKIEPVGTYPTAVPQQLLVELAEDFCHIPDGFTLHPKVQKVVQDRLNMVHADPSKPVVDWGMAEHLAYATILADGHHIRISGQDARRGTFSHRHAVWVDQKKEDVRYFPLSHLKKKKALFDIFNSSLSEYAVLGFEFGYSLAYPTALVIWEAQYGDFANGAQIAIDQYIAASEQKWGHRSSVTLMLPHGHEGAGPEHTSARMERYLQLCGDNNMQIVHCSNPAQLFHVLRRQVMLKSQKPLVLFTPKAYLRNPAFQSCLNDFTSGTFEEFLDDPKPSKKPKRLFFCSGKFFYELMNARKKDDAAILRIEQLYPFNMEKCQALLKKYAGFQECIWAQEEHQNMGAWTYVRPILEEAAKMDVKYVGRSQSATPAAGSHALHKMQLEAVLKEADL